MPGSAAKFLKSAMYVSLLSCFTLPVCFAQSTQPLVPGTVVIGQCWGHSKDPGCTLPSLFGSTGLSLYPTPAFPHYAHFIGPAQTTLNQTLSTAIATQLAVLPIISPSSGFTYKYDSASGAFVRTTTSFGPIYAERAETIGRGKVSFGVSYQRFRFSNIDGIDLHNIPAVFGHLKNTGPGNSPETYEADVIQTNNNVDLKMDTTMFYGTVGLTDRLDFSVAIPLVSVRMGVTSNASIIRVSGPSFTVPGLGTFPNPHQFTSDPNSLTNPYGSNGSATGIGDVSFRLKANVWRGETIGVAVGMDVRTPTGNELKLLGSGAVGLKPFVAVSAAGKRFSPHINIGYQWNGKSILAGDVTGTTFSEDSNGGAVVQNGPAVKGRLPSQVFYTIGTDYGATKRITLSFDYMGQALINTPRVFRDNFTTQSIPGGTGALTLPNISGGEDTAVLSSAAVGAKVNLIGNLLLTGEVLFRLDDKGLRQTVAPLVALSYAVGK
jgi:hypothetical protein